MSRKFLTPKDEYAVSRTVKAFESLNRLTDSSVKYLRSPSFEKFVKEPCRKQKLLCCKKHGNIIVG